MLEVTIWNALDNCIANNIVVLQKAKSYMAQMVKNLLAMLETWVWTMGGEDPLEKEMATHSSILAWRIPWTEEPAGLQSMGSQRVGHNWASILKSRDITLPPKVHLVKALVFPVLMYVCESWIIKKAKPIFLMLLNCGVGEDSWESLGLQGDPASPS